MKLLICLHFFYGMNKEGKTANLKSQPINNKYTINDISNPINTDKISFNLHKKCAVFKQQIEHFNENIKSRVKEEDKILIDMVNDTLQETKQEIYNQSFDPNGIHFEIKTHKKHCKINFYTKLCKLKETNKDLYDKGWELCHADAFNPPEKHFKRNVLIAMAVIALITTFITAIVIIYKKVKKNYKKLALEKKIIKSLH